LTLSDPPRQSRTIALDRDMTIGANGEGDGVDVSLAEWQAKLFGVSRRHVLLRPAGTKVFVIDLGSTNGTFVNGIQITRGWARPLTSGCLLTLGRLNLWFHLVESAA
jgi:pSer/pThr/pTyr-binding forkhead associated (FHA) protein